jgi:uncharacterized cupredoxin-like copper-binding protein
MGRLVRVTAALILGLLLTGCLSSEPKVAEVEQVAAVQREEMQATEAAAAGEGEGGGGGPAIFVAVDIAYEEAPTEVTAGTVQMELDNQGTIEHDVVIEELGDQPVLAAAGGESDSASVDLEPGTYTYYCNIPGHREAGMEGQLTASG